MQRIGCPPIKGIASTTLDVNGLFRRGSPSFLSSESRRVSHIRRVGVARIIQSVVRTFSLDEPRIHLDLVRQLTMLLPLLLMLLHQSTRAVEPSARGRGPSSPMDLAFDERSSWINASDRALPFVGQSPWSLSPSLLSSRRRKRIVTETEQPDDPTWIRVSIRSSCSCESQYEIRDLGDGNYPRYLTASRCKPKSCQNRFYSCRLLHYMVPVLRQRESSDPANAWYSNDDPLPETPLPESLRHQWQLKPISVAVACVSAANTKRN